MQAAATAALLGHQTIPRDVQVVLLSQSENMYCNNLTC